MTHVTTSNFTKELNDKNVAYKATIKQAQSDRSNGVKSYINKVRDEAKNDEVLKLLSSNKERFTTIIDRDLKEMGKDGKKATTKSLDNHTVRAMKIVREIMTRDLRVNVNALSVTELETLVMKFNDETVNACYAKSEEDYCLNVKNLFADNSDKKLVSQKIIMGNKLKKTK